MSNSVPKTLTTPPTRVVRIGTIPIGAGSPLVLIAGPCVVEGRDMVFRIADKIQSITSRLKMPFIFKSSYKKANRTSGKSFTSIGDEEALKILGDMRRELGIPLLTDVHSEWEAQLGAEVADILQIPAFLCRQTELLVAAGKTGKAVNIKKGQFVAPEDMSLAAEKVASTGNTKILLTERGSTFGYHNLVVDMRSLPIMRRTGYPVVLDATHSVQLPGGEKVRSGGQPEFIFPIARAGVAAGCDAVFIETHPNPARAKSDAASQLKLDRLESLLKQLVGLDQTMRRFRSN
ncbi:MAG TPA: 3-deoxy-8-phosphooctulonate synthase [Bacteroidota bacterium]